MDPEDEEDASIISAKLLLTEDIASRRRIVLHAAEIRKTYSKDQLEILAESHQDTRLDEMNLALALSKMSESCLASWERNIDITEALVEDNISDVLSLQDVQIVSLFLMFLSELKPRSRKHLKAFLESATENEWVVALLLAKGTDSEVRSIDRASESTLKEFGLGKD